ncbi:uncharacterized protein LOC118648743 isoform X2 [Monomorium pharaonis]|uniref:uncharacterized protein LOC118648743 isoform X2 n=1 Tax=Monomorium pharaonis TaxID=307658 RepID=UPI0017463185|nr:uncharacterized protein LOC118648743 isoform X2 [Monomorium pharaonis]
MSLNIDFRALFVIVIVISTLAACYQDMLSSRQQNDIKTLSTACNNFMISLYKNLSTNIDNIGNIVISPLSLHMTLSLLSNGAGDHTLNEIKSVLHHDDIISLNNGFNILALLLNSIMYNVGILVSLFPFKILLTSFYLFYNQSQKAIHSKRKKNLDYIQIFVFLRKNGHRNTN